MSLSKKDEAKALGARWDAGARKWYVPDGKDLTLFSAWLPAGSRVSAQVVKGPTTELALADSGEKTELTNTRRASSLSELLAGVARRSGNSKLSVLASGPSWKSLRPAPKMDMSISSSPSGMLKVTFWRRPVPAFWANTASRILPEFERATGASIAPGIKLLVRAKPVFKAQYGFGIEIDAIDPDYTLGDLEARKREIRTRLKQEGRHRRQQALAGPPGTTPRFWLSLPKALRVGDSKQKPNAWSDSVFVASFTCISRFQGEGAPQEIRPSVAGCLGTLVGHSARCCRYHSQLAPST